MRVVGGGTTGGGTIRGRTTRNITDLNLPVLCEGEGGGRRNDWQFLHRLVLVVWVQVKRLQLQSGKTSKTIIVSKKNENFDVKAGLSNSYSIHKIQFRSAVVIFFYKKMYFYKCKYRYTTGTPVVSCCTEGNISNRNGHLWLVIVREEKSVASSNCFFPKVYISCLSAHQISYCEIRIGQCFEKCCGLPGTFWPGRIQIPIRNTGNQPDPDLRPYPAFWT